MGRSDDGDVVWIIACPFTPESESEFGSIGSGLQDERSIERS